MPYEKLRIDSQKAEYLNRKIDFANSKNDKKRANRRICVCVCVYIYKIHITYYKEYKILLPISRSNNMINTIKL